MSANRDLKMKDGQGVNGKVNEKHNGIMDQTNRQVEKPKDRSEVCGESREKYSKELTVEVVVEGDANISMMDLLRGVKMECGEVVGCRVRGERTYELTMKDEDAKKKLIDGVRIKGAMVHARDIVNNEMVVSFINLPVYLEDGKILDKLEEWGVKPLSAIKRRAWPGTDTVDGTRFLKVRFTDQVRSLPYSTRFETLRGTEYFRVIHDRQVRVCRLCIKPGHLFRECPEFKCFRCGKVGHYVRECGEQTERVTQEGRGQRDDGKRRERDQPEEPNKETGNVMESTEDGGDSGEGEDKTKWCWRVETTSEEADDEERMEEEEKEEEDGKEGRTEKERGVMREATLRKSDDRREKGRETSPQRMQTTAQKLSAKRKAEKDKDRIEQIKELRSGM